MTSHGLIIAPAWVGDLVMSSALCCALKQQQPHTGITLLVSSQYAGLARRFPDVDEVIPVDLPHGHLSWRSRRRTGHALRGRFHWSIVLPNSWKSALIPWWARVPVRRGWLGEARWGLLNEIHRDTTGLDRMVLRFWALKDPPGLPRTHAPTVWPVLQADAHQAQACLRTHTVPTDHHPVLALCPGAAFGPSKQWPADCFADIASRWLARHGQVWLMGGPAERTLCDTIRHKVSHPHLTSWAGRLPLAHTVDLLSLAHGVISNDSGLMHVAAALGRPTLGIFGSTSPAWTPPLGPHVATVAHDVPCRPCFQRTCPLQHHDCMRALPPQRVWEQLHHLLQRP